MSLNKVSCICRMTTEQLSAVVQGLLGHPMIICRPDIYQRLFLHLQTLKRFSLFPSKVQYVRQRIKKVYHCLKLWNRSNDVVQEGVAPGRGKGVSP